MLVVRHRQVRKLRAVRRRQIRPRLGRWAVQRGRDAVDDQPVGRKVAYWRTRRRMSQQVFADRLGKSKSWVDKVERGVRRLDKFSTIAEIADVLQVEVAALTG